MLTAIVAFASCEKSGYTVTGDVENFAEGAKVYLAATSDEGFTKIDSTTIQNKSFTFKGESKGVEYSLIQIEEEAGTVPFQIQMVLENGKIKVTADKNDIEKTVVSGTKNNDDLQRFNESLATTRKEIEKQQEELGANDENEQDFGKIIEFQQTAQKKMFDAINSFIDQNKDSYVSLFLLANLSQAISTEELKEKYNALSTEVKETRMGKEVADKLKKIEATTVGQKAPDFKILGTDRKTEVSLYENLGKVTIIDFWASWCKPCRVENPNMVKLYEKYKDKGLKIIGVSLDTDEERWKEAIEKDGLPWIHVASLVKDDPTADMYNVEYIPTIYILNEKGIILAKNVYGEELDENIGKLLN